MSNLTTNSVVSYFKNAILPGKKILVSNLYFVFLNLFSFEVFKNLSRTVILISDLSSLKLFENLNQGRPDNDLSGHLAEEHGGWFVSSL